MRLRSPYVLAGILWALYPTALFASPQDELDKTQKEMAQARQSETRLAEDTSKLELELEHIQEKLVATAQSQQQAEGALKEAKEKLRILDEQLQVKNELLQHQQKNLAALVQAALSLSRLPSEAIIMMPGDSSEIMKVAPALKMATGSIREETQSIGLQLAELRSLKEKVAASERELSHDQEALAHVRQGLETELAQRKALQGKLGQQQKQEKEKIIRLAKKAGDLEGLLATLNQERTKERNAKRSAHLRSFVDAKGRITLPATGSLVQHFGASQGRNATSKGIIIATQAGAQVTAPYDGEVVFTGPFLNYGQMIIIRHSDDYHTLLAGLTKIDAQPGEFLLEGEPIGAMGESGSGSRSKKDQENRLYLELRKNNQPVDPTPWISGLNKKN